jgi:hypothetical protein
MAMLTKVFTRTATAQWCDDGRVIRAQWLVRWAIGARWGVVPTDVLEQVYRLVSPAIAEWEKEHLQKGGA